MRDDSCTAVCSGCSTSLGFVGIAGVRRGPVGADSPFVEHVNRASAFYQRTFALASTFSVMPGKKGCLNGAFV